MKYGCDLERNKRSDLNLISEWHANVAANVGRISDLVVLCPSREMSDSLAFHDRAY